MTFDALARTYLQLRAKFARTFPRVARLPLYVVDMKCTPGSKCRMRDVGWYDGRGVWLLARVLRWKRARVVGVLMHELGHASDEHIDAPGAERRADLLAKIATGRTIRYDRADVQTIGRGRASRPAHLHQ